VTGKPWYENTSVHVQPNLIDKHEELLKGPGHRCVLEISLRYWGITGDNTTQKSRGKANFTSAKGY
jgi:hypothetical protein